MKKPAQTDVYELVEAIDSELSARRATLENKADELQVLQNKLAAEKSELETAQIEFAKEKAGFDTMKSEVDAKFNKIRNDQQLTEDLRTQAIQAKAMQEDLKNAREERMLTDIQLEEIKKRELALSKREKTYQEEIERKFVGSFFKG